MPVRFLSFLLAMMFMASSAFAHPTKEAETDIQFNENSGKVEIIHRFHIPDAEQALHANVAANLDLIMDAKAQAAFGHYVEERFTLSKNGEPIALEMVGGEIADGSVWVYQRTDPLDPTAKYSVKNTALMDTFSHQVNTVHVRINGQTQSFVLSRRNPGAGFTLE